MIRSLLFDGAYAAIAAIGFAAISNPPKRAYLYTAIAAAIGHSLRYLMIEEFQISIIVASFFAALIVGFLGVAFAELIHCPAEVFSFPALLPMIPGLFAYRSLLGIFRFMQTTDSDPAKMSYLISFTENGIKALLILISLCVGVAIPIFIFYQKSFQMTRKKYKD